MWFICFIQFCAIFSAISVPDAQLSEMQYHMENLKDHFISSDWQLFLILRKNEVFVSKRH